MQGFTTDVCVQYALLCALHEPGTGPSPICLPVWDDGTRPEGGGSIRAPAAASEPALLHLQKKCLDPTNCVIRRLPCVWRGCYKKYPSLLQSHKRGRISTSRSSLCEMPAGKKLKQLVAHHHRAPSQASWSRLSQPRPPAERVLPGRLYFLITCTPSTCASVSTRTGDTKSSSSWVARGKRH